MGRRFSQINADKEARGTTEFESEKSIGLFGLRSCIFIGF